MTVDDANAIIASTNTWLGKKLEPDALSFVNGRENLQQPVGPTSALRGVSFNGTDSQAGKEPEYQYFFGMIQFLGNLKEMVVEYKSGRAEDEIDKVGICGLCFRDSQQTPDIQKVALRSPGEGDSGDLTFRFVVRAQSNRDPVFDEAFRKERVASAKGQPNTANPEDRKTTAERVDEKASHDADRAKPKSAK